MLSERRHHRERLKKSRATYWGGVSACRTPGRVIDTPAVCSCWMCGNPRKYSGERTIQERSAEGLFRRLGIDG